MLLHASSSLKVALLFAVACLDVSLAHDRRHASPTPEMKAWFDSLRSGKGPCCSDADGTALSDLDWKSKDGKYSVFIGNRWIEVPDDAVLAQPNKADRTMVWPIYLNGETTIRCFIPGSMM